MGVGVDGQGANQTQFSDVQVKDRYVCRSFNSFLHSAEESELLLFPEGSPEPKGFAAEGDASKTFNTSSKQKQSAFPRKVQGSEPEK